MLARILVVGTLAVVLASAQRGGGGRGGGGMGDMGGGMGMMMPRQQTRAEQVADKLKLNKEQKEEFAQILSAGAEEAAPLRAQLNNARVQLAGALIEGKGEPEVKKAQDALTEAEALVTAVEVKAFAKIYAILKPNQQSRAPQAFELMTGIFVQGGRGSGGMGRREGR